MRSLPETRSRRLISDSKDRLQKRLKNGFGVHHVTTRSQAKIKISKTTKVLRRFQRSVNKNNSPGNPNNVNNVKSPRKTNECTNGIVRLRGTNSFGISSQPGKDRASCGRKSFQNNGLQEDILQNNGSNNNKTHPPTHKNQNCCFHSSLKSDIALQRAEAAEKRADRLKKRRSALWVLNCEAESFLFGETAAEDHEVELPPMSTPPKKRRRVRTNELGSLLKESPILGSKLRSPSESSRGSWSKEDGEKGLGCVKGAKAAKKTRCSESWENVKSSGTTSETCSEVGVEPGPPKLEAVGAPVEELGSDCPSIFNSSGTATENLPWLAHSSNTDSVRINNILSSMEWKFSFEELPSDETWYTTFKRQEKSRNSLPLHYQPKEPVTSPPLLLPYETKILQSRSPKKKLPRLPRKSPRCHASTLAILSSLKNRGRHRTDLLSSPGLISVPIATSTPRLSDIPETGVVKKIRKRFASSSSVPKPNSTLPARTPSLPPVSPPQLSASTTQTTPQTSNSPSSPNRIRDLSATQYLWDSIQLLSDPYVIQILAGSSKPKNNNSTGNSNHTLFSDTAPCLDPKNNKNSRSRKNSGVGVNNTIRSGEGKFPNFESGRCNYNFQGESLNLKNNVLKKEVFSLKSDGKLRVTLNGKSFGAEGSIPIQNGSLPPKGSNGLSVVSSVSRYRKTNNTKKSPVVLVADIFKNARGNSNNTKAGVSGINLPRGSTPTPSLHNMKAVGSREELLFLMEGLPPLPAWPV